MKDYLSHALSYLTKLIIIPVLAISIPITIYAYTQGGTSTVSINTYTLSNGEKTVVFQSMYHIGLRSFYQEVGEEMNDYRNKGYRVLFEGIGATDFKPLRKGEVGYEEAVSKYNSYHDINKKILDDMDKKSVYKESKYTYQSIELSRYMAYDDIYADLSYKSLHSLADDKAKEENIKEKSVIEYKNFDTSYSSSSNRLLDNDKLYIYLENIRDFPVFKFYDYFTLPLLEYFMPTIKLRNEITINARNKHLVKHILEEPEKLIYITYGQSHFKGVFDGLKESDPNWKIVTTSKKVIFKSD